MPFDKTTWTEKIKAQLKNWRQQMESAGAKSIYAFLSASTIWPIVEAARAGEWEAAMALGSVLAGLGSNLLADRIKTWKDKVDATQKIEQEVMNNTALRNEIDLVLEKLDSISLAHTSLNEADRQWFQTALQTELTKLGNLSRFEATLRSIVSSGAIQQSILVTGDNNSITYIINQYADHSKDTKKQQDLREQIANYLTWLCDRCGKIELRGIEREGQQVVQLALEDVYVPLEAEAFDPFIEATGRPSRQRSRSSSEIDLSQVLRLGKRIIITGGPGCGKTTVLIYMAWILGQAISNDNPGLAQKKLSLKEENLPLPLFIPLSAYATFLRENKERLTDPRQRTLASFISHYLIEKQTNFDLPLDFFQQLLRTGQSVILLLDGLDEVPNEDERAQVRQAIEDLVTGREDMMVVATCRTAAYKDRTALGKGFREVRVKPLNEKQVAALVQQAYYYIYRHDPTLRQTKIEELLSGIRKLEAERQERLGEMAEPLVTSPLVVRMLLVVHFSEQRLPEQRAELYLKATDVMLFPKYSPDEKVAAQISRLVGTRELHCDLAQHLAFAMHQKGATQGREIGENDLKKILNANPSFQPLIEDFIRITRLRGTLLEERLGVYRFIHLAFQEYLAARYLAEIERARAGVDGIARFFEQGPILDSWWREPALLVAGYLSMTSSQSAQMFLRRLASIDDEANQRLHQLSPDIQLAVAEIAGSACLEWQAAQSELKHALIQRLVQLFNDKSIMERSRPTLRASAGDTLARLGDPRPEVTTLTDMPFCLVPKGPFWMGSNEYDSEKPFHQNDSIQYDYWISRYPITNAQFQFFVDASDGYINKEWWTKAGLEWRGQRTAPEKYGGVFDLPNHPVVYVRWYEAVAFTRWLTAKLRQEKMLPKNWQIRLPTEAEWEKAARGGIHIPVQPVAQLLNNLNFQLSTKMRDNDQIKRRYPWGDNADPNCANYNDTKIGTTSAVGCFPGGASPYGCEELSGNVWEWCSTIWRDNYEQKAEDQLEGERVRVVRGGSFFDDQWLVRCAVRYWYFPLYRYIDVGFRVVLSPVHISLKL